MTSKMHLRSVFFFVLFCFAWPSVSSAQETGSAEEANKEEANKAPESVDPSDKIVSHIDAMSNILADNMNNPTLLSELFKAYLDNNRKDMRAASTAFEKKFKSLKVNEAEAYRETLQRKMEPALERLMTLLIQFGDLFPDQAKALDAMLKVDI